jgi:UDP:flavonoid glycosyltransferase YjiC (YdhE family)
MRVLLSTIGSRGDVQPLVALALELRALGQEVRLCVPPDFREWIEGLGLAVTPIGPELRALTAFGRRRIGRFRMSAEPRRGSAPSPARRGSPPLPSRER